MLDDLNVGLWYRMSGVQIPSATPFIFFISSKKDESSNRINIEELQSNAESGVR